MASKNPNRDYIYDKFKKANFTQYGYQSVMREVQRRLGVDLSSELEKMDKDQLDRFFRDMIVPVSAEVMDGVSRKYPDEQKRLAEKQMALAKSAEVWDADKFKGTIGRKPYKENVDGKEVSRPAVVGRLSPQDYAALRNAGLSDEDIEMYASKFRKDDQDRIMREGYKAESERLKSNRESMANEYPYNMLPLKSPHDQHWFENWLRAGVNSFGGAFLEMVAPEIIAEQKQAIREGRDPDMSKVVKAGIKDAAFGIGSLYTPAGAGRLAKLALPNAGRVAQGWAGSALSGLGIGAETYARQMASDHYDTDLRTAVGAGLLAGTVPGILTTATSKLYGIPGAQRFMRPVMKRVRGLGSSPAESEAENASSKLNELIDIYNKAMTSGLRGKSRAIANEALMRKAEEAAAFINSSWRRAGYANSITVDDVLRMLKSRAKKNPATKFFEAPTGKEIEDAVWKKTRYQGVDSDIAAEELSRMESQWPNTYSDVMYPERANPVQKLFAGGINLANDIGGKVEPIREFKNSRKKPSKELQRLMNADPNLIRQWEMNLVPPKGVYDPLYEEWREKYGNR